MPVSVKWCMKALLDMRSKILLILGHGKIILNAYVKMFNEMYFFKELPDMTFIVQ